MVKLSEPATGSPQARLLALLDAARTLALSGGDCREPLALAFAAVVSQDAPRDRHGLRPA